jgi:glyoxylase I family protein
MQKFKVGHVAITVSDIEKSKKFYEENFGFTFIKQFEKPAVGAKFCYLELEGFQIELWEFASQKQSSENLQDLEVRGLRHLAFVVDDVEAVVSDLQSKGLNFSDVKVGSSGKKFSLGSDLDGIGLEIIEK